MNSENNINIPLELRKIKLRQDRQYYFVIAILGMMCNFFVFASNGFLMPVKVEGDYEYKDNTHFTYNNKEDIKLYRYSDIIGIQTEKYLIKYSIGDILILISVLGIIYTQIRISKN